MAQVLRHLPPVRDPRVLVGTETLADAAVYRISDDLALVQTIDFIPPIVDDPYSYGAIAAAHALSDIYAMGATPVTALNVIGFPTRSLPISVLGEIMKGVGDKATEAGVSIIGGHSVDDNEPKCGLSVTGLVDPKRLITNGGAQPEDFLVLTKPLGTGIISAAIDQRIVEQSTLERVVGLMATLNRAAAQAMVAVGVNACTDIGGFGLLGHLRTMVQASRVGARVEAKQVPIVPEARALAEAGVVPEGTYNNHRSLRGDVSWEGGIAREFQLLLCDAQASGGLLIAVAPHKLHALQEEMASLGVTSMPIGRIIEREAGLQVAE